MTLRELGRLGEAEHLMNTTILELERALGVEHPHIGYTRQWQRINRDLEPQPV